jgi:hypothetical protein
MTTDALCMINIFYIGSVWLILFGLPEDIYIILFFFLFYPLHNIYFWSKNRHILIISEFQNESNQQRIIGKWLAVLYVVGAGLLFLYAIIYGK